MAFKDKFMVDPTMSELLVEADGRCGKVNVTHETTMENNTVNVINVGMTRYVVLLDDMMTILSLA